MERQSRTLGQIYLHLAAEDDMEHEERKTCDVCQKHVEILKSFQEGKSPEEIRRIVMDEFYQEVGDKGCFEHLICLPMIRLYGKL